jgi:hypothetical protein
MRLILGIFIYRLLENGAKLQIDPAHLSDAGSYTCQMSNIAGQVNLTYRLDVFSTKNYFLFAKMMLNVF